MIQKNSKDWHSKTTVKKGDLGEFLVDKFLMSKGMIPYHPNINIAHPFDRLVASKNKKIICIVDIKTKARRNYYPDTGIDKKHYDEYTFLMKKYNIPVFLFFVDEMEGCIYGNYLHILSQPTDIKYKNKLLKYPLEQNGIIYFPLCLMRNIAKLDENEIQKLRQLSTRNYLYLKED